MALHGASAVRDRGIATPAATAAPRQPSPVGVHSMLYLDHPFSAKEAMFKAAAALGATTIRLDIALSGVFPDQAGPPDWSGVDQYTLLARRYRLHVLADLLATAGYMADCANIHVRTSAAQAATVVRGWPRVLAHMGFTGPLWRT
jgi:hypothetical protein